MEDGEDVFSIFNSPSSHLRFWCVLAHGDDDRANHGRREQQADDFERQDILSPSAGRRAQSANQIVEIIQRYLALFPHEQANLSTVLYNCDAASLPQAVVNQINELHEDDNDMRCEVILRHRDRTKLHKLYEAILEAADADTDGFVSSEASRDFMARLRIGIMADQAPIPNPRDGPRTDLVFLHDVIARRAKIEWYREDATPVELSTLVPSRWSRRRPSPTDEEKSIVYLCCPAQTDEGWAYLAAISSYFRPDWDADGKARYLPARQLDFHDPETSKIFEETHNLGNWVVNFDELLDRRQLVNQGVKVIRYKQAATQGRNLLVSSNAPLGLLQSMLQNRIRDLIPDMSDDHVRELASRFIDDANLISGDIVLRAAKRGRNASELMGVVLSHYLAKWELGPDQRTGCYFRRLFRVAWSTGREHRRSAHSQPRGFARRAATTFGIDNRGKICR